MQIGYGRFKVFIAVYSESECSFHSGIFIGDIEIDEHCDDGDDGGDEIAEHFDIDAAKAACASICCFGKSCDGHSKWTQWKIYRRRNEFIFDHKKCGFQSDWL